MSTFDLTLSVDNLACLGAGIEVVLAIETGLDKDEVTGIEEVGFGCMVGSLLENTK